jgi:putative transposase
MPSRIRAGINPAPTETTPMGLKPSRKRIRLPLPSYELGNAFFITIDTHLRHPWFGLHAELATEAQRLLLQLSLNRGSKIYAWCIMPDHIHLLLLDKNVVDFVRLFKGAMTQQARVTEKGRRLWQRSFHDHGLRKDEDLEDAARYIWENPVRKRIVDHARNYVWSGSLVWAQWRDFFGLGETQHVN